MLNCLKGAGAVRGITPSPKWLKNAVMFFAKIAAQNGLKEIEQSRPFFPSA
jgi:hypothetical protein